MDRRLQLVGEHTDLTDAAWASVAPLVAVRSPGPGRPARDHRAVVNGILWVLDTGAPWRQVPAVYGPWQTLYGRYTRWRVDGTWHRLAESLSVQPVERIIRRTVAVMVLAVLAAAFPQPARAQRVGGAPHSVPVHMTRVGRRTARRRYGVRPVPSALGESR